MPAQQPSNNFRIEIDNVPLPAELMPLLVSVFVDDSLNLPDMFLLAFRDPDRSVLERAKIEIGKTITISVISDAQPGGEKLISKAEVTALEAEFEPAGTLSIIRGLDQSHRLFRGRRTESYQNTTYSDIAKKVARRANIAPGTIDPTTQVFAHVSQGNVSDWEFLKDLARKVGYEVTALDGKLDFRKPTKASGGPASGTLRTENPLQLTLGANLLRFRSVVTSSEQVKEVKVRAWDVTGKKALIGSAPGETGSVTLSVKPTELAGKFGDPIHIGVDTPYESQAEVDAAAKALAEEIAGSFAAFDGVARGNPKLKAGTAVSLGLAGKPFDGRYTLTTTRHVYDSLEGYTTWFTVSGRQDRSLLGLASGGNGSAARRGIEGVVPAIVTNARDPQNLCRVKLKFPWMSDTFETDWVRTVQPGAGAGRGTMILPEVNDEVLVAFEHGDIRRPYVLGGLYNGVDKPPSTPSPLIDANSGNVDLRGFVSRTGHRLLFSDARGKEHVELQTGGGKFVVLLDKANTAIEITSGGKVTIKGSGDVEITSDANVKLKAGANLDIEAGGRLKVKGAQVSVEASGPTAVKGTPIQLN
ncbi:MAG: VgrG-related protein [Actinomycetota bacterium]